jgi:hypothetical protein
MLARCAADEGEESNDKSLAALIPIIMFRSK